MITVNVMELFLKSAELLSDGYQRVELSELEGDDDLPPALSFSAIDEVHNINVDYEEIEDCSNDETFSLNFSPDSIAPYTMTLNELGLISNAFHNAIENCKTCLNDKSISADLRSEITSSMKNFESYVNKLDSFLGDFSA